MEDDLKSTAYIGASTAYKGASAAYIGASAGYLSESENKAYLSQAELGNSGLLKLLR